MTEIKEIKGLEKLKLLYSSLEANTIPEDCPLDMKNKLKQLSAVPEIKSMIIPAIGNEAYHFFKRILIYTEELNEDIFNTSVCKIYMGYRNKFPENIVYLNFLLTMVDDGWKEFLEKKERKNKYEIS